MEKKVKKEACSEFSGEFQFKFVISRVDRSQLQIGRMASVMCVEGDPRMRLGPLVFGLADADAAVLTPYTMVQFECSLVYVWRVTRRWS